MKRTLLALVGLAVVISLSGCGNPEEKKLETSAPPVSENATTFEQGGGEPKPVGERGPEGSDGPQGPAMKPPGM
jgi:predicted small lipoprotein YifL